MQITFSTIEVILHISPHIYISAVPSIISLFALTVVKYLRSLVAVHFFTTAVPLVHFYLKSVKHVPLCEYLLRISINPWNKSKEVKESHAFVAYMVLLIIRFLETVLKKICAKTIFFSIGLSSSLVGIRTCGDFVRISFMPNMQQISKETERWSLHADTRSFSMRYIYWLFLALPFSSFHYFPTLEACGWNLLREIWFHFEESCQRSSTLFVCSALVGLMTYLDWTMVIVTSLSCISMLFESPWPTTGENLIFNNVYLQVFL